ncbi:hypothetical protein [Natrarchaeobaculum sulfurireducens]|uniref:Uncharacterized protein n=1 Tax=Natrarchaeobaculum sulfurireducens TaxID=2044521 RepID=A0A346PHJ5_9EURY|nr:hypothetical protein [Natrarchaeobaculum sulfurireducens]AXR78990.1 hypothetical protein AArc1_2677 [Natrarchaeobaculum sulfurireducens]
MTLAEPDDVRLEIDTNLEDDRITKVIERKARDIDRDDGVPVLDEPDRRDLEAVLAALHIATKLDRATSSQQLGNAQKSYEESMVEELRADARRLGATDELIGVGGTDKTASIAVPDTRG